MLKKIPTDQARLGMFLQSMEGSWLSHPFWKTRFLIDDPADLESLKRSGVPFIWIDVAKGKDVELLAAAPAPRSPVGNAVAPAIAPSRSLSRRRRPRPTRRRCVSPTNSSRPRR